MAIFMLLAVSTYMRPCELLPLLRCHLVRPDAATSSHWSVLVAPQELGQVTKTNLSDVSVILDFPWLTWMHRLIPALAKGPAMEPLWGFSYHQLRSAFTRVTTALGLEGMTLYQTRHSGPSIDRMGRHRSLLDCKARGFWKSESSLHRYEKSSRVAADYLALPSDVRMRLEALALLAEGRVLGKSR